MEKMARTTSPWRHCFKGFRKKGLKGGQVESAAVWLNTRLAVGPTEKVVGHSSFAVSCVGESPSWSRHRILIPTCEGSSPSSPAKFLLFAEPALLQRATD